jgi:hypothetical protein
MSDPTQRGDEIAANMRAYFEANKHRRYVEGNADSLMLGLLNIALAAGSGRAETRSKAQCEASQSGDAASSATPKPNRQSEGA